MYPVIWRNIKKQIYNNHLNYQQYNYLYYRAPIIFFLNLLLSLSITNGSLHCSRSNLLTKNISKIQKVKLKFSKINKCKKFIKIVVTKTSNVHIKQNFKSALKSKFTKLDPNYFWQGGKDYSRSGRKKLQGYNKNLIMIGLPPRDLRSMKKKRSIKNLLAIAQLKKTEQQNIKKLKNKYERQIL